MNTIRKIFVAVDGSPCAGEALKEAHSRAMFLQAKLAVCHILPNELRSNVLFPQFNQNAATNIALGLQQAAEAVSARVQEITGRSPGEFEVMIDHGIPYAAILSLAEKWLADLVVVGSQGTKSAAGGLGSVADRVIRYAHCPVLVVKPGKGDGGIVVGTDFSDPALPALKAAADEARRTGATLTVVHSLDHISPPEAYAAMAVGGGPFSFTAETIAEMESISKKHLEDAVVQLGVGKARAALGPAAIALVEIATELKAGLLVVGTIGRTGLSRVLLGNVAESVAKNSPCSVLVVRLHHHA